MVYLEFFFFIDIQRIISSFGFEHFWLTSTDQRQSACNGISIFQYYITVL